MIIKYLQSNKKLLAFIAVVSVSSLMAFVFIFNHSFLLLSVPVPAGTRMTLEIVNQEDLSVKTIKDFTSTKKVLLAKSSYEIHVHGSEYSFVKNFESGRFLETVEINGALTKEKFRASVGYNPSPCMVFPLQTLYSYECRGRVNEATVHLPATSTTPTFTVKTAATDDNIIQDIAVTNQGTILLSGALYEPDDDELMTPPSVSLLSDDLVIRNPRYLNEISPSGRYKLAAYRDGFIVYSDDLSQVLYFADLTASPVDIDLPPTSTDSELGFIHGNATTFVAFYGEEAGDYEPDELEGLDLETSLYVNTDGVLRTYSLPQPILTAVPCEGYICVVDYTNTLKIYKAEDKSLKSVGQFKGIKELVEHAGRVSAVTDRGILDIKPATSEGYYSYTFGGYVYCGWKPAAAGYLLCLIDDTSNKIALKINSDTDVTFPIDKRLFALQTRKGIETVSLYKNQLFVTPTYTLTDTGEISESNAKKGQELLNKLLPELGFTLDNDITVTNTLTF